MTEAQKKVGGLLLQLARLTSQGQIKWKRAEVYLNPREDWRRTSWEGKGFIYNGGFHLYIFYPDPSLYDLPDLTSLDWEKGIRRLENDGTTVVLRIGGPGPFWEGYFAELRDSILYSYY